MSQSAVRMTVLSLSFTDSVVRHRFSFRANGPHYVLGDEAVEAVNAAGAVTHTYFSTDIGVSSRPGRSDIATVTDAINPNLSVLDQGLSILSKVNDIASLTVLDYLTRLYKNNGIYRSWIYGGRSGPRASHTDSYSDHVLDVGGNLNSFLSRLKLNARAYAELLSQLRVLYDDISDVLVVNEGEASNCIFRRATRQFLRPVFPMARCVTSTCSRYSATRPPKLICIEEPELGLHPDIIPTIAKLLVNASQRTQLIVTTHSDILVEALSDRPESVLVCEKHDGQTQINRLDSDCLKDWLEKYSLGQLWTRGQIGGTRW